MQTFVYGNKRIDIVNHKVTNIRTVELVHGRTEVETNRTVTQTGSVDEFSRLNQRDHYLLPPQAWFPGYVSLPAALQKTGIVAWRADTREPGTIMKEGFEPRIRDLAAPVWRCAESDVYPLTTVCLSPAIESAILFPLINSGENGRLNDDPTWIYAVWLQHGDPFFNTQFVQREIAYNGIGAAGGARALAKANAEAAEVCVQRVSPERILLAIRCLRYWRSDDWTALGKFAVDHSSLTVGARASIGAGAQACEAARKPIRALPALARTKMVRNGGAGMALFE